MGLHFSLLLCTEVWLVSLFQRGWTCVLLPLIATHSIQPPPRETSMKFILGMRTNKKRRVVKKKQMILCLLFTFYMLTCFVTVILWSCYVIMITLFLVAQRHYLTQADTHTHAHTQCETLPNCRLDGSPENLLQRQLWKQSWPFSVAQVTFCVYLCVYVWVDSESHLLQNESASLNLWK